MAKGDDWQGCHLQIGRSLRSCYPDPLLPLLFIYISDLETLLIVMIKLANDMSPRITSTLFSKHVTEKQTFNHWTW